MSTRPTAVATFIDYLGDVGTGWGLPRQACRVHAYLYVIARPASVRDIAAATDNDAACVEDALAFLADYHIVEPAGPDRWRTSADPWDLLLNGLEERRRRELPNALATLRECRQRVRCEHGGDDRAAVQIDKMLRLVEDLAAIDRRAIRVTPLLLRGVVSFSGRAARVLDHSARNGAARRGQRSRA